jgi:DHA1 family bicyclomycin/chloramphenicol resistance-like MFS transporter
LNEKQPILGRSGFLFFLVLISAFPPLTIDLYLPALPQMVELLDTNKSMVNLTLSVYFVTYAVGLLFWGPLSEKQGRKPILFAGIGIYIIASLLCAVAPNIEALIGGRLLQAFGGSAITVISTAVVKDMFEGREREKIMATVMSLVIIAPMVAPIFGAFLLKVASWRMMFVSLAAFGVIAFGFACCYKETLEERYTGTLINSWSRLFTVVKNPRFISLLVIFSVAPMALMAFLAAGSYIYIDGFGLTEQQFSYFFSFNALCASFGPSLYMKISRRVAVERVITVCLALIALCGVLTISIGDVSPFVFALIAAPATMAVIATRVPGTNLMLNQQDKDTGSAVAIIQFVSMMSGSLGMVLVSISPETLITNLGMIQLVVGVFTLVGWLLVRNRSYVQDKIIKSA